MSKPSWSPDLAYIVGLLTTDGNLSKDGRHITMRSSDLELLITFSSCLFLYNKISQSVNNGYAKKPSYRIQFSDVELYRWLLNIGLTPNKTHTIGELIIPDIYFRDFLRGHLDGDGSVYTYIDSYTTYKGRTYTNQRVYTAFISVSETHIRWLHRKISELTGLKGSLTCKKTSQGKVPMWVIRFAKKDSLKLLHWIYYKPNLPCLQRKMLMAQQIAEATKNEKRRHYTKIP